MKIFVINPGSTSTKLALYNQGREVWRHTLNHSAVETSGFDNINMQLPYRMEMMEQTLTDNNIALDFDAVIARGGLVKPTPGGVYAVDERLRHDLEHSPLEHACNLGGLMADLLAAQCGCPAFIADPEVVDELMPEARLTGLPDINRRSIFHALNTKAVARRYAESIGRNYEDLNLIMVHLGGGISVGAHRHGMVIDVNNALNGDGPFTPERAGTIPADDLVELCFSGNHTKAEIKRMLNGRGGLSAHLGTTDVRLIAEKATAGEEPYRRVLDAMLYTVAREVGARAVALKGDVDAIILTGGIAHSDYCVTGISQWISFIAPIVVRAGEDELDALAFNALGALSGHLPVLSYNPQ